MKAILALAMKDMKLLIRDKGGAFFVFVFPLIVALFFGVVFGGNKGGPTGIEIAVVDLDKTAGSEKFVKRLETGESFKVARIDDPAAAAGEVRRGKRTAYVLLKPGFGEGSERMFWGDPMTIELGIDPARSADAAMIEGLLTAESFKGMQDLFTQPEKMQESMRDAIRNLATDDQMPLPQKAVLNTFLAGADTFFGSFDFDAAAAADPATGDTAAGSGLAGWQPIKIEKKEVRGDPGEAGPKSAYDISFPQGIIWGILGCAAAFSISLVSERIKGTLVRLRMAPLTSSQILAGKGLACFLSICCVTVVLLAIGRMIGLSIASPAMLALAVFCVAICFVGIMMLLSVLGKTEQSAGGVGWMANTVMAMLGGGMIPLFVMPGWMKAVSSVSPVKWAILALEGGSWRGFTLAEMALPCGILLAVGVIGFAIGASAFKWNQ